jgi:hypothetical protein
MSADDDRHAAADIEGVFTVDLTEKSRRIERHPHVLWTNCAPCLFRRLC